MSLSFAFLHRLPLSARSSVNVGNDPQQARSSEFWAVFVCFSIESGEAILCNFGKAPSHMAAWSLWTRRA
jgi:hypothetical protein